MADKTVSKHLIQLEKLFASGNPALQQAIKTFHELDQLEYDLGLLDENDTTARKLSWWPIVSTIGGHSPSKNEFLTRFLNTDAYSNPHKFTIFQYTAQASSVTLPGTAVDADHRLPFYQISRDIENIAKGEGTQINAWLELVTVNSDILKNRLLIDTPVLGTHEDTKIIQLLTDRTIAMSDLVLVFSDFFEAESELIKETVNTIVENQDSNKFLFVIDHSELSLDAARMAEIIGTWRRRLRQLGINTGEFVVLTQANELSTIQRRINNLETDRAYRILAVLEQNVRAIEDVYVPEVRKAVETWKDRTDMTTLIILGFLVTLLLFAEITMGVLDILIDPIIGPIFLVILVAILLPIHLVVGKVHARLIIDSLYSRQRKLNIPENLAGMFEKGLSFWRTIWPIKSTIAERKKYRKHINQLLEKTKDLVQSLNDQFSHFQIDSSASTSYQPSYDNTETFDINNNNNNSLE